MAPTPTALYASPNGGEMLPVEELASQVEVAIRSEVNTEYCRLRERFGIEPEAALKMATKHVQEILIAVADDEKTSIVNGGYRQTRMVG